MNKPQSNQPPVRLFLSLRVDFHLMQQIQTYLASLKLNSDFRYSGLSDFIRQALLAHKNGMALTYLPQKGPKKFQSVMVDQEIFDFYNTLPEGNKASIVERCLGTYFQLQLSSNKTK